MTVGAGPGQNIHSPDTRGSVPAASKKQKDKTKRIRDIIAETIRAISDAMKVLREKGVSIVRVSQIIKKVKAPN